MHWNFRRHLNKTVFCLFLSQRGGSISLRREFSRANVCGEWLSAAAPGKISVEPSERGDSLGGSAFDGWWASVVARRC